MTRQAIRTALVALCTTAALAACGTARYTPDAQAVPQSALLGGSAACVGLLGATIPASDIGLPTSGATVTSTEYFPATTTKAAYCQITLGIHPVDPLAQDITLVALLPDAWNKKAVHLGGGGFNGVVTPALVARGTLAYQPTENNLPVNQGYILFGTDAGHAGTFVDGYYGINDEMASNHGGDALKKARDAMLAITKLRYHGEPQRLYFYGASKGGHEGFVIMERWPHDYDGVFSMHPAASLIPIVNQMNRIAKALYAPGGFPNASKTQALNQAVRNACDDLDGANDGLVSHVSACAAKSEMILTAIRCEDGADTGDACLSDAQLHTVRTISTPIHFNYSLKNGVTSSAGYSILQGADFSTPLFGNGESPEPLNPGVLGVNSLLYVFSDQFLKYFVTRKPTYNSLTFTPEDGGSFRQRMVELSNQADANSYDLTAFRNSGGKLILAHGTADEVVPYQGTVDLYGAMQKRMGVGNVRAFTRFYVIPGFGHGTGAFIPTWDALTDLDAWVTTNTAPTARVVTDTKVAGRTRPLCEYPAYPKYNGTGNINDASSFTCATK